MYDVIDVASLANYLKYAKNVLKEPFAISSTESLNCLQVCLQ